MARTFRNRHSVPHGFIVRDGGRSQCTRCLRRTEDHRAAWLEQAGHICEHVYELKWNQRPKFRRSAMRKERKDHRKPYQRTYRARVRDAMSREDWENIPRWRRTSGWLTW